MLPDINELIYLDFDIVFLSPVEELWKYFGQMSSTQMIGIVRESYHNEFGWFYKGGRKRYKSIPYIPPVPFNAGVLLMNLTRMRNFEWSSKSMEIFESYKEILVETKTADQGLINIFLTQYNDSFLEIPCHWNYIEDHCMYEKDLCASAQILGIGIFHHHAEYDGHEKSSYIIYDSFKKFSFNKTSIDSLIKKLTFQIQNESKCKPLFRNFIIGIERFLLNSDNPFLRYQLN